MAPFCPNPSRNRAEYSAKEKYEALNQFAELAAIALSDNAQLFTAAQQELVERKRIEDALQQAKETLEIKVEQRTEELNGIKPELKAVNEQQSQ